MYPYNLQNNNRKKKEVAGNAAGGEAVADKELNSKKMSENMKYNMNDHMHMHDMHDPMNMNGMMNDDMNVNGMMNGDMNMNDTMDTNSDMNMNDMMNANNHMNMNDMMNANNHMKMEDTMDSKAQRDTDDTMGETMKDTMKMYGHTVDEKILELIKEGMKDEVNDAEYYKKMQSLFQNEEDKNMVRRIGLDEKKHKKMLDQMYTMLSGKLPPNITPGNVEITRNVLAELNKKITDELEGVEYYRRLHSLFEDNELRDMAFEMMVDENIHAIKLTHLYSKYK